jgi:hypothetical protein
MKHLSQDSLYPGRSSNVRPAEYKAGVSHLTASFGFISIHFAIIFLQESRKSKEGGKGLMQVEGAYIAETINLVEYVERKEDPLIRIVRTHQHNTNSVLLQNLTNLRNIFKVKQSK